MALKSFRDASARLVKATLGAAGRRWKPLVLGVALTIAALGTGGFLFAWSGLAPISASAGHWPITNWLLHFVMRNAVETQAIGIEKPSLTDPALVLKGAGHYATGCAFCHGAPGQEPPLIPQQMTPKPPYLPPIIFEWTPEQLFWIVKHGIKATAMPAWVSQQRDDEVWAMVAFLQALPAMSPEQYRELAYGPRPDGVDETLANCTRCHGTEGLGRGKGVFPKLAGQSATYLEASLIAYAKGERNSGIMQPIAAGLTEETMRALATHYADQEQTATQSRTETTPPTSEITAAIERGKTIAARGIPERGVPSCTDCHGPQPGERNPFYPTLSGQYSDYLALQLALFKAGKRGGTPYAHIMHSTTERLTNEQIRDLALYYNSLGAEGG